MRRGKRPPNWFVAALWSGVAATSALLAVVAGGIE